MRRSLLYLIKLGLPLALFTYLLWSVDRADYQTFWSQPKRWDLLLGAQLVALIAIIISILRWQLLVRCLDIPFNTREALRLGFLGYLLNFISLGSVGGDLFKAILVAKEKHSQRPEAVASVLLDRAIGLLGLIILAWISIRFLADNAIPAALLRIGQLAGALSLTSIFALLVAVYAGRWLDSLIEWVGQRIPRIGSPLSRMAHSVRLLRRRPASIAVLLFSAIVVHAMLTLTVYLVSHGLYPLAPTLSQHFVVVPPAMAVGALPIAPGGLGVQEGAIVGLFRMLPDVPEGYSSTLVATVFRLVTLTIAGIGVGYYLASHGREWRYAQQVVAEEKSDD
ncbi:MAG: flippase-like domain-containing protein [Pirellulaceae bacterium]|nr:flippase-like domain-containing protein [Pirellulaceae bacterium]